MSKCTEQRSGKSRDHVFVLVYRKLRNIVLVYKYYSYRLISNLYIIIKSIYSILIGFKPGCIGISLQSFLEISYQSYNNLVYRVESRNQNLKAYERKNLRAYKRLFYQITLLIYRVVSRASKLYPRRYIYNTIQLSSTIQ